MNLEKYNQIVSGEKLALSWDEYREVSPTTLPNLSKFYELNKELPILDKLHCILGIVSETSELEAALTKVDIVNIGEEISDKLWYISALSFLLGWKFSINKEQTTRENNNVSRCLHVIRITDAELIDLIKKDFAYKKEIPDELYVALIQDQINACINIAFFYNIDVNKALGNNIRKLYSRSGNKGKFDAFLFNNRNLEAERTELER